MRLKIFGYSLQIWLLCTGFLFSQEIYAQNAQPGFGIEGNLMAGKIFKHTSRFTGPIPNISGGADVNFVWKTYGKAAWQQNRKFPTLGLGITYTYFDKSVYGQSIGFYPNIEFPLVRKNQWEWAVRFGMGLGYISKRNADYAPDWDTLNNAVGAHINNFSLLASDVRYRINDHLDLQAGLSFTHMSSARFRVPNLGINFLGAHIGFRYFPNTSQPAKIMRKQTPFSNRYLLQARVGIAMSTGESRGSAATPVQLASLFVSKRYWGKNKIFAGLDYSYHQSIYDFMRLQAIDPGTESKKAWKSGLFIGHEFLYGHVGLHLQLGYYIHDAYLANAPIYQKIGMNWYILQKEKGIVKELSISTLLKTHYADAELAELGLGISF